MIDLSLLSRRPDGKDTAANQLAEEGGLFFNTGGQNASITINEEEGVQENFQSLEVIAANEEYNKSKDASENVTLSSPKESPRQVENLEKNGSGFYNPVMGVYRDFIVLLNRVIFEKFTTAILTKAKEILGKEQQLSNNIDNATTTPPMSDILSSFRATSSFHFADAFAGVGPLSIRIHKSLRDAQESIDIKQTEKESLDPNYLCEDKANLLGYTVSANDMSPSCYDLIRNNCLVNEIQIEAGNLHPGGLGGIFKRSNSDANLFLTEMGVLGQQNQNNEEFGNSSSSSKPSVFRSTKRFLPATHVHLDPFGCVTNYLDAAVNALDLRADRARAAGVSSVLSVTATDVGVLYDRRYIANLKRHYGVLEINKKRHYTFREQGARILLGAIARSCGRRDCGIKKCHFAFPYAHFILCSVEVDYKSKNRTVDFMRMSKTGEGPFYMGPIFDRQTLLEMWAKSGARLDDQTLNADDSNESIVSTSVDTRKFLNKLLIEFEASERSPTNTPFFCSIPDVARKLSCSAIPSREKIIEYIMKNYNVKCSGTVFDVAGGLKVGSNELTNDDATSHDKENIVEQALKHALNDS